MGAANGNTTSGAPAASELMIAAESTPSVSSSVNSTKLARSTASRSLSGFAGSVNAAPGTRTSGRGSGDTSVVSIVSGGDAAATAVVAAARCGTATPISVSAGAFRRTGCGRTTAVTFVGAAAGGGGGGAGARGAGGGVRTMARGRTGGDGDG